MNQKLALTTLTLLIASLSAGCDGDPSAGAGGAGGSGGADQGSGGADQGSGGSGSGSGSGSGGQGGSASTDLPPTDKDALFQWLKGGSYTGWAAESGPHSSAGPHGGKVRTFMNTALLGSLTAASSVHPKGGAAVKELYGSGDTITGWAVELKTADDSAGGQGWYWYEIYSTTDPSNTVAAGNGVPLCFNCHSGGTDYVLSPFPLQ